MAEYVDGSGYCANCQKRVVGRQEEPSHTFWLIASIFSCGLFAIVWFLSSLSKSSKPFKCSNCGLAISTNAPGGLTAAAGTSGGSVAVKVIAVIFGLGLLGSFVSLITGGPARPQPTPASTAQPVAVASVPPAPPKVDKAALKKESQRAAADRARWAKQYEDEKRADGFSQVECSVSGPENTTLKMVTFAAVSLEATKILDESGYYDNVFEHGFKKLILEDTVGHVVTLTRN